MEILGPDDSSLDIDYEPVEDPRGTAIIVHGLGGFKEQDHIIVMADACRESGFSTIRMNTRHALVGDGKNYAHATISACVEDLHAVVMWVQGQDWFTEPLLLAGHSLGGISVLEEAHHHGAHLLIPVSPVVSAKLLLAAYGHAVLEWRTTGWRESESSSKPGVIKRLDWHRFGTDLLNYDALSYAATLNIPTLLIVGSDDSSTPPSAVRALADELPDVTMHVIDGAPHTFRDAEHLEELHRTIATWLQNQVF